MYLSRIPRAAKISRSLRLEDDMAKAQSETGDPFLLTPGPLTTSASVKRAMVHDWGSRDATFVRYNR